MRSLALQLALLLLPATASAAPPTAESFRVESLPGLATPPSFKHYSGFMPLGDKAGTHLFFWFVESQRDPASDPLLYWTNGGPGSSSVAYGFWTEHGPWRLENNGTEVVPYEYSWNRKASVLYVEQPSGVGLSWSADQAHHSTNDEQVASPPPAPPLPPPSLPQAADVVLGVRGRPPRTTCSF